MNPIRTNKPVFFGNDGEVLKSGMIYIGQPNQWPISFPKTVTFQDSAGSQFTAQQPMRTNSQGQIEYNGKAIIALVDGNYSMLVRDRNGVNVNDGYTPFIENSAADADLSSVTQVGLLLSDIKQFDVTPGETVRNVGKMTATDKRGADWLVVSATGSLGDDNELIDFSNGTQGRRTSTYSIGSPDQKYQDVSASRVSGTTYINDTGRAIMVIVEVESTTAASTLAVDGLVVSTLQERATITGVISAPLSAIVPSGSTYQVQTTLIYKWVELR